MNDPQPDPHHSASAESSAGADPSTAADPGVNHIRGGYAIVIRVLAFILRLWCRTLRFKAARDASPVMENPRPGIFLLWHNRLFIIAEINRRYRRHHAKGNMHGLVSASKDGAYLSYFFERVGIVPLRGSSSRRGAQALREIMEVLDQGGDIGITPDGPRGPCYDFKPGVTLLMRKTSANVVMIGARYKCAIRLKSWDGFYIPLPFSTVLLDYRQIDDSAEFTGDMTPTQTTDFLSNELRKLNPDN